MEEGGNLKVGKNVLYNISKIRILILKLASKNEVFGEVWGQKSIKILIF